MRAHLARPVTRPARCSDIFAVVFCLLEGDEMVGRRGGGGEIDGVGWPEGGGGGGDG